MLEYRKFFFQIIQFLRKHENMARIQSVTKNDGEKHFMHDNKSTVEHKITLSVSQKVKINKKKNDEDVT